MQRYFIEKFNGAQVTIDGEDVHHISRVMRMNLGDQVICCDQSGQASICKITEITNESVKADVVEWIESSVELPVNVTIASGLPKGDKLEYIIQKGTELGADSFVPFNAARSVVKWDAKKADKKLERWSKITKEAAEQSHRTIIPTLLAPLKLKELIQYSQSFDKCIIAYEEDAKVAKHSSLKSVLDDLVEGQSLFACFGPEGGLTKEEVELLQQHGFISCSLGPRILRTETAPMYLLSAVSYQFELSR